MADRRCAFGGKCSDWKTITTTDPFTGRKDFIVVCGKCGKDVNAR